MPWEGVAKNHTSSAIYGPGLVSDEEENVVMNDQPASAISERCLPLVCHPQNAVVASPCWQSVPRSSLGVTSLPVIGGLQGSKCRDRLDLVFGVCVVASWQMEEEVQDRKSVV